MITIKQNANAFGNALNLFGLTLLRDKPDKELHLDTLQPLTRLCFKTETNEGEIFELNLLTAKLPDVEDQLARFRHHLIRHRRIALNKLFEKKSFRKRAFCKIFSEHHLPNTLCAY